MSVICTVDKSEFWQQLCNQSQHQVVESPSKLSSADNKPTYILQALNAEEIVSLINEHQRVTVVVSPAHIVLRDLIEKDHSTAISELQNKLDALYSLYKRYRSSISVLPLSAFCCNCSTDTSAIPWLEKTIDASKTAANIDSVIAHSLYNQSANAIKAYKKVQSCFSLKDDESIFYPDITKLQHALTVNALEQQELLSENERVIEQNFLLLDTLETKLLELSSQKDQYTQEIKHLQEQNKAFIKENNLVSNNFKEAKDELDSTKIEYASFVQTSKKELTALEKTKNREIKQLESKLEQKSQVEQTLRAELAELRAIKSSKLWKVSSKVEKLSNVVDKQSAKRKKLSQDMSLLYTSELFDADWYLETYSDVKKERIDPAEHYLLYGAKEGRKPSPLFDGNWYLQANPDVASENTNPLIHYIKFGREEKRPMSPVMITYKKK